MKGVKTMHRRTFVIKAMALVMSLAAPQALAQIQSGTQQSWPQKPIKLLVAYPPGGVSDVMARMVAERLAQRLNVPVLVENRAGASGALDDSVMVQTLRMMRASTATMPAGEQITGLTSTSATSSAWSARNSDKRTTSAASCARSTGG